MAQDICGVLVVWDIVIPFGGLPFSLSHITAPLFLPFYFRVFSLRTNTCPCMQKYRDLIKSVELIKASPQLMV